MAEEIVNRVARSGIISFDLEAYYPKGERVLYDIKQNLWQEIALKEKEFRLFLKEKDWSVYQDQYVALDCSVDAIIPTWAYMLLATKIVPYAKKVVVGNLAYLENSILEEWIEKMDMEPFIGARVVIKGCSDKTIPTNAYVRLVAKLQPYVAVLMFGEPCSTVPLWKKSTR